MKKLAARFYEGKTETGARFELIKVRHWEVIVGGRRFMPYETKASALNAVEACLAAPEKGFPLVDPDGWRV